MAGPANNMLNSTGILKECRDAILDAIDAGIIEKDRVYTHGASEVNRFYLQQHKYLFNPKEEGNAFSLIVNTDGSKQKNVRQPIFQITDNLAAHYQQTMAAWLLQGEIARTVEPNKPLMPSPACYGIDTVPQIQMLKQQQFGLQYVQQQQQAIMQMNINNVMAQQQMELANARAEMLEKVLNYEAKELGLHNERKRIIEESLVLGGGVWLTQPVMMPGTNQKLIGSQYVMMSDIVWDPDATRAKDCKWLAIQFRAPVWQVAGLYGIPESDINPSASSTVAEQAHKSLVITAGPDALMNRNIAKDEITYWKWWSRMGSGAKLKAADLRSPDLMQLDQTLGDFVCMVVTSGCDYPLNVSQMVLDQTVQSFQAAMYQNNNPMTFIMGGQKQEKVDPFGPLKTATSWPVKYYLDVDDPWPVTMVEYHLRNGSPYPIPPLQFVLSLMKFMVWVISFVADKCYRSNRSFWAIDASNNKQLRTAIEDGEDEAVLELKELDGKTVEAFVKIIDAPDIRKSLFEVYQFFENIFRERTNLTEVMQAQMSRATRSATEAATLRDAATLRPQQMSDIVYRADTRVARKEAIAAQSILEPQDVQPILGNAGAQVWNTVVRSVDIITIMRETSFDVVASAGRTHDLNTRQDQSNKMAQMVLPLLVQIGQATGVFGPANAILVEWAKANQIDPALVQLPDMPPPQMIAAQAKGIASPPKETKDQLP